MVKSLISPVRNSVWIDMVTQYDDTAHLVFQDGIHEKGSRFRGSLPSKQKIVVRHIDAAKSSNGARKGGTKKRVLTPNPKPSANPVYKQRAGTVAPKLAMNKRAARYKAQQTKKGKK